VEGLSPEIFSDSHREIADSTARQGTKRHRPSKILVWKIESETLLPVSRTPWLAEGLRRSLMSRVAARFGSDKIPEGLSGHSVDARKDFQHSAFVPLDLDLDGFLDHLAFSIPDELDEVVRFAALGLNNIRHYGEGVVVLPLYFGPIANAPALASEMSRNWTSVSPWAHPWYLKKRFGFAEQLIEELRRDGYPKPVEIEFAEKCFLRGDHIDVRHFPYRRPGKELVRHAVQLKFVRVTFESPVEGPLLLGRARNFGYGLFVPS
jgi:CRISPR-associated protein Csb2